MARLPLDVTYAMQVEAVRNRVEQFALTQFATGQHRNADMARYLKTVVPVILASRRQVSALTDSYLSQTLSKQLGKSVRPHGPIDTDALRGVPADEVYTRPYKTVWTKLSDGLPYESAVKAGLLRVTSLVLTDLQMAKTYTSQSVLTSTDKVVGYNRVPNGGACPLCLVASQQRYHIADLMPIHDRCSCDVQPIISESAALPRVTVPEDVETAVHHNSEVGPILTVKGQEFTTVHDLAA